MKRTVVIEVISCLLIILFIYTGFSKYLNFDVFISDMQKQPFPNWLSKFIIWTLPGFEIVLGVLLLSDKTRLIGLWTSFFMMGVFTLYTGAAVLRLFDNVPCGCGGMIRTLSWKQHLLFNAFFTIISFIAIKYSRQKTAVKTEGS